MDWESYQGDHNHIMSYGSKDLESTISYELIEEDTTPRSAAVYRKYRAVRRDRHGAKQNVPVSVGQWARGLSRSENAAELSEVMVGTSHRRNNSQGRFQAAFWETPSVRPSTMETQPMEFVLIDAPRLQKFANTADPSSFAEHFRHCNRPTGEQQQPVGCVFESLGRDAILISPRPVAASTNSNRVNAAHLMAYLQTAPTEQRNSYWKTVGETYLGALQQHRKSDNNNNDDNDAPLWLSTSGLGVAYLHIRIDRRPKYYTYDPYKQP
jgi:hypothetical protein